MYDDDHDDEPTKFQPDYQLSRAIGGMNEPAAQVALRVYAEMHEALSNAGVIDDDRNIDLVSAQLTHAALSGMQGVETVNPTYRRR